MDGDWTAPLARARDQHGVLHVAQAEAEGLERSRFYRATRSGLLTPMQRGVALAGGAVPDRAAELAAIVLSVGGRVAVTGLSALHLRGLIEEPPTGFHLAVPADRNRPRLRGEIDVVRTRTLSAGDVETIEGFPCTTTAWSLLHVGRHESDRRVRGLAIRAAQRGEVDLAALSDVLDRCGRAPGRRALRLAYTALSGEAVDSSFELDVRRAVRMVGLEPHPAPFPFGLPRGQVVHLDVPFPAAWFAIECDTDATHADPRSVDLDRRRWSAAQAAGWRITWVTPERLRDDRAGFLREVQEAIAAADPTREPPRPTRCRRDACRACQKTFEG